MTNFCYPGLKVQQQGNQVLVQPAAAYAGPGAGVETLTVDLASGKASVSQGREPLRGSTIDALGILGLCQLKQGAPTTGVERVWRDGRGGHAWRARGMPQIK